MGKKKAMPVYDGFGTGDEEGPTFCSFNREPRSYEKLKTGYFRYT